MYTFSLLRKKRCGGLLGDAEAHKENKEGKEEERKFLSTIYKIKSKRLNEM